MKPYAQCGYCGKYVRQAGFLAGWHVCRPEAERLHLDWMRSMQQQQQQMPPYPFTLLGLLGSSGSAPANKPTFDRKRLRVLGIVVYRLRARAKVIPYNVHLSRSDEPFF